ncbi:hypothetical protein BKA65DRAFT_505092 [Rhexocercosporidium sp. MPI-PUGE-AT-0058]|nr:hypothetical protein BKA65DRAFT_505092 [Rhexocercosporidium sp. MPI-PUGE-AT-0058]
MSTMAKPVGLLLRLNAKSFEPINALRAKYPAPRLPYHHEDPQRTLLPVFCLLHSLPGSMLPAIQSKLSSLATLQKPFSIKTGAPRLFKGNDRAETNFGFGFELPTNQIEQLRKEIYDEFSAAIKAEFPEQYLTKYKFVPRAEHKLAVRHSSEGFPKEKASEILAELQKQYPDGFGTIAVEGFALQEHVNNMVMRISQDRMVGEYPFGSH